MYTAIPTLVAEQPGKAKHGLLSSTMYLVKGGTDETLKNVVGEFQVLGQADLLISNPDGGFIFTCEDITYPHTITHTKKEMVGGKMKVVKTGSSVVILKLPYIMLKVRPDEAGVRSHMPCGGVITIGPKGWCTGAAVHLLHKVVTVPHFDWVRRQLHDEYGAAVARKAVGLTTRDNYKAHHNEAAVRYVFVSFCAFSTMAALLIHH